MARVSMWGFAAHAPCVRGMLMNTYYLREKLGLKEKNVKSLPKERLKGYRGVSRRQYQYDAVWKQPCRRLVPSEWTLKYVATVVLAHKVRPFLSKKRKDREELREHEEAKRQKRLVLDQKRAEAVAARLAALEAHPQASMVRRAIHVLGTRILGDLVEPVLRPTMTVKKVVLEAEKYDPYALARAEVRHCLANMMLSVEFSPRNFQTVRVDFCVQCQRNVRAKTCPNKTCGRCCTGCRRHSFKSINRDG